MPNEQTIAAIGEYVTFVKNHVKADYGIDIDDMPYKVLEGKWMKVFPQQGETQPGLYLNNSGVLKIYKTMNGVADMDKLVLIGDLGADGAERVPHTYFGIIFHEFGHAAYDKLGSGRNCEDAAYTVELSCLVAAVLAGKVSLDRAQDYMAARLETEKAIGGALSGAKDASWIARAITCRDYLKNRQRALISYPYRQQVS
jgi:hypothetical protein